MHKRPLSITVIGWILMAAGGVGLVAGLPALVDAVASRRIAHLSTERLVEVGLIGIVRILAVLCGACVLYGFNWARWLAVAWMGYHVVLSVLHSPFELFVHSVLFAGGLYVLFRPRASAYFHGARAGRHRIGR